MTSPLAVLSDAALYIQQMEKIEQMEQLNKLKVSRPNTLKLAAASPVSIGAGSYSLGCGYPSPYGTGSPTVPLVLVMPPLWNSAYAAAGQVAAGLNPYLSPAGTPSPYGHPPSYCQPQPNTRDSLGLVLNPTNLSTGSRSLGSTESEGLPLYVPTPEVTKQQQQLQPQSKPSTIVRNPTYQSVESPSLTSKVVMRQKKNANTLDRHFRRSLGYENPIIKKRPATIAYHEVDDHFEKVFGADEWQKLNAKRKKLNRHSVI